MILFAACVVMAIKTAIIMLLGVLFKLPRRSVMEVSNVAGAGW